MMVYPYKESTDILSIALTEVADMLTLIYDFALALSDMCLGLQADAYTHCILSHVEVITPYIQDAFALVESLNDSSFIEGAGI